MLKVFIQRNKKDSEISSVACPSFVAVSEQRWSARWEEGVEIQEIVARLEKFSGSLGNEKRELIISGLLKIGRECKVGRDDP
jgi:glutamate racemase